MKVLNNIAKWLMTLGVILMTIFAFYLIMLLLTSALIGIGVCIAGAVTQGNIVTSSLASLWKYLLLIPLIPTFVYIVLSLFSSIWK